MAKFWAVLPHGAGFFQAQEVEIQGETRKEVLDAAWAKAVGSRYVSRSVTHDGKTTLYSESGGWTEAANAALPQ